MAARPNWPQVPLPPTPSPRGSRTGFSPTLHPDRSPASRCGYPEVPLRSPPPYPGRGARRRRRWTPVALDSSLAAHPLCDLRQGRHLSVLGSLFGVARGGIAKGPPSPAALATGWVPGYAPAGQCHSESPPRRGAAHLGLEAEKQQVQQPVGDKSRRDREG